MPSQTEEIAAVRREIINLLRRQMEALDSPEGMTDSTLTECYERQDQVRTLRDRLQAISRPEGNGSTMMSSELSATVMSPQVDQGALERPLDAAPRI